MKDQNLKKFKKEERNLNQLYNHKSGTGQNKATLYLEKSKEHTAVCFFLNRNTVHFYRLTFRGEKENIIYILRNY